MNLKDEAALGLAILSVQQALMRTTAFLNLLGQEKHSLKWTYELKCLKREVRWLSNEY